MKDNAIIIEPRFIVDSVNIEIIKLTTCLPNLYS